MTQAPIHSMTRVHRVTLADTPPIFTPAESARGKTGPRSAGQPRACPDASIETSPRSGDGAQPENEAPAPHPSASHQGGGCSPAPACRVLGGRADPNWLRPRHAPRARHSGRAFGHSEAPGKARGRPGGRGSAEGQPPRCAGCLELPFRPLSRQQSGSAGRGRVHSMKRLHSIPPQKSIPSHD